MNRHEYNEALSSVRASDALLTQVLSLDEKRKPVMNPWRTVRRLAAVAAVLAILLTVLLWPADTGTDEKGIISAPGVLKVYACELEDVSDITELKKYELTDTIDSYKKVLVPYTNNMGEPIPFTFQISEDFFGDAEISFFVSADYGWFYKEGDVGDDLRKEVTISDGEMIHWLHGSLIEAEEEMGQCGRFYANIIIYADKKIVGYGIVDFVFYNLEGMRPSFVTNGFTTVCFPLLDGEFQDVSEEYVWEQIEEYKRVKPDPEVVPMG